MTDASADAAAGHGPRHRLIPLPLLGLALGGALAVLAFVAITARRTSGRLETATEQRQRAYELLVTLRLLRQHIGESRVGVTGYALMRDSLYRAMYDRAISEFGSDTARLHTLSRGTPDLASLVTPLGPAIAAYVADLESAMRKVERGPAGTAAAALRATQSTILLEGLRLRIVPLEDALNRRLEESAVDVRASVARGNTVVMLALLLGMLLTAASGGTLFVQLRARERVAQALRKREQQQSSIYDTVADVIFLLAVEADGYRFVSVNQAFQRVTGIPGDQVVGKRVSDVIPEPSLALVLDAYARAIRENHIVRWEETSDYPTGRLTGEVSVAPVFDEAGHCTHLVGAVHDVTERKRAEEAIRASESRYHDVLDNMLEAAQILSFDWRYLYLNDAAARNGRQAKAEMLGRTAMERYPGFETTDMFAVLRECMERRTARMAEFEFTYPDGTKAWFEFSIQPVPEGLFVLSLDITARKRLDQELRALNADLERRVRDRTAQLETATRELEAFSYSVAHDLRAPLRTIDGFSLAVLEDCADRLDDDGRKHLRFVREAAQHMSQLIDALLTLSRVTSTELHRERVDLSAIARAAVGRLQRSQPGRAVEVVIGDGLTAEGDPRLLTVVLDNLLDNAWKFTVRREAARIEFGSVATDGHAVFFVRDNGAGFDMAFVKKLFGVFQRLHAASEFEGTGVGLATVQRIVSRHGGRAWAEGEVSQGATFYFTLNERQRPVSETPTQSAGRGEAAQ